MGVVGRDGVLLQLVRVGGMACEGEEMKEGGRREGGEGRKRGRIKEECIYIM